MSDPSTEAPSTEASAETRTPADESPGAVERAKATYAHARGRIEVTLEALEAQRPERPMVDLAYRTYERDAARGGGLLAGALSYRFFFWLLPFVLVLVGGLGFLASASDTAPQDLAKSAGVVGFAAQSISQAAADSEHIRVWAILIGLPALYLASVSFVKALMVTHALMWGVPNHKLQRKPIAAAAMTGLLIAAIALISFEGWVRSRSEGPGLLVVMAFLIAAAAGSLFVSFHMPRPSETTWRDLVPGAIATAVGIQVVHLVTVYYVSRKVASASSSYGGLGAAAGILLSLFFIARVFVVGAAVNAEAWERKHPIGGGGRHAAHDDTIDLDSPAGNRFRHAMDEASMHDASMSGASIDEASMDEASGP